MCKKELIFLVFGITSAIPIVCGFQVNEAAVASEQTSSIGCGEEPSFRSIIIGKCQFDAFEVKQITEDTVINENSIETFAQACKHVSGVEIDLERNDRLYKEYEKCVKDLVDPKQFTRDFRFFIDNITSTIEGNTAVSDQQNSAIFTTIEKYCPIASNVVKCMDTLTPIFTDCYSPKFNTQHRFDNKLLSSIFDFFCEKDAENAIKFVNEKFMDCILSKNRDLHECIGNVKRSSQLTDKPVCQSFESLKNCFVEKSGQCPSSKGTFGIFAASAFTHIQTNACASQT